MSVALTVNGQVFQYPELDDENWAAAATGWAQAVTAGMLQKAGGTFTLTADVDFGASYGLKSLYYKSRSSDLASAGVIRLANTDTFGFRNAANSANLLFSINPANDHLLFDGFDISASSSSGNVVGPVSSVDNTVPRFNGITGQIIQGSSVVVDDSDNVSGVEDLTINGELTLGTIEAASANTIADTRTRSTGTSVGAGGVAISNSSGLYSRSTASYQDVTNLSVTITTTGRPVKLFLIPDGSANNSCVGPTHVTNDFVNTSLKFVRDSTDIGIAYFELAADGTTVNTVAALAAPSSICTVDAVVAGTYTYKIQARGNGANSSMIVYYCKLVAYEL